MTTSGTEEHFKGLFLPPSTPPPPHARRRAKAPSPPRLAHAVAANAQPDTPTRAGSDTACSTGETFGERKLLAAASAPENRRSVGRVCSSADVVVASGAERECVGPPNRATAGPRAREDNLHIDKEGREDFPGPGCGDLDWCAGDQHGAETEPVSGGWGDSCDGSAAKRRAHDIRVRVAALEGSLDRVEEETLGALGIGTSSGVGCMSAGVERERSSESSGEEESAVGMRDVTDPAARPVTGG